MLTKTLTLSLLALLVGIVAGQAQDYFPPPESQGGWRSITRREDLSRVAGMDPMKLDELREWLNQSDNRNFAATVIRRGYVVLEVERNKSAKTSSERVASCSKAICATVLAIAAEDSAAGRTPRQMTFDSLAFDFIPWAQPLSDPRKARITVKQLLNHTSGIAPESTGAPNRGPWEYVLGFTEDTRLSTLAFDPGTDLGYSTHALYHAALVCENVTGKPYDQFAIERLFRPLGIEQWWFEFFDGREGIGRHPTHGLGLPAREMARLAYCLLRQGRWDGRQVVPQWFVDQTAEPTHALRGRKDSRFHRDVESWSHGWELPSRLTDERGRGLPRDARFKPGSGGQLIAFVPSLDLVVARQTGSSGDWAYEEFLRRACEAVQKELTASTDGTTLTDPTGSFTVPDPPYVVLRRGPLAAAVVDNRAWDFQWIIPNYQVGRFYQLVMRVLYRPLDGSVGMDNARRQMRPAVQPVKPMN